MERKERVMYNLNLRKNLRSLKTNDMIKLGNFAVRRDNEKMYSLLIQRQGENYYTLMYDDLNYNHAFFQFKVEF